MNENKRQICRSVEWNQVPRHPQIYTVLQLTAFSVGQAFARLRTKNVHLSILITNAESE